MSAYKFIATIRGGEILVGSIVPFRNGYRLGDDVLPSFYQGKLIKACNMPTQAMRQTGAGYSFDSNGKRYVIPTGVQGSGTVGVLCETIEQGVEAMQNYQKYNCGFYAGCSVIE